jgi:hypothetical protein
VLSKLLFGTVQVRSYDWEAKSDKYPRVAKFVGERILKSTDPALVLLPNQGNLHSFTALTQCAFYDILAPPYTQEMPQPSGTKCVCFQAEFVFRRPGLYILQSDEGIGQRQSITHTLFSSRI